MKIKEILYTPTFKKAFNKLPKEVQNEAANREKLFSADAFDSKLKTHKLKGRFKNYYSFSISYSHRTVFRFLGKDKCLFVDCGDHSVYK
jgi:mRNA-degrading endonuclease YafQ of YafQ-DinJ toxin-antitoxin module